MSTQKKKFLKPVSAVIATLLASSLQSGAVASPELRDSFETASKIAAAEPETPALEQLTVEPSQESIVVQQHMSHSSHSSHSSHYSSRF